MQNTHDIDIHVLLAERNQIALIWSIADVHAIRPDLTAEQAWQVLQHVERRHDAELGVNWLTLHMVADELFGPASDGEACDISSVG